MQIAKATRGQVRQHNRQLVLRAVYSGAAEHRAALASETDLTKPTIGELVGELLEEGLLIEEGLGQSTDVGGKRPRLLRFNPEARQVIAVSINADSIVGILTHLNGEVLLHHKATLETTDLAAVFAVLVEVINALYAHVSAPLLHISVGVNGLIDESQGIVRYASGLGWRDAPLAALLRDRYGTAVSVSNSIELAVRGQYAFKTIPIDREARMATVLAGVDVGVGWLTAGVPGGIFVTGSDLNALLPSHGDARACAERLGWRAVEARLRASTIPLGVDKFSYVHLRYAATMGNAEAVAAIAALEDDLAEVFTWVIALLRPTHLSLAGRMAHLGADFLGATLAKTAPRLLPQHLDGMTFSTDTTYNLSALGAAAKAIQALLGVG